MNEERIIRKLAAAARADEPPLIDVSDRVLSRLPAVREPKNVLLWTFSAISSVAAAIIIIVAIQVTLANQDPVAGFLGAVSGSMR